MIIGTVKEVWRYPVKSMFGERVSQASIEKMGMPEDRAWALRDEESGEIVGGKKIPGIMTLRARYTQSPRGSFDKGADTPTEILFPDGRVMASSDPYISAALSMYLGRRVSLCRRLPASEKEHYALAHTPSVQQTRYALGIRPEEDNPDLSSFSLGLLATLSRYATPPGTYYDVYPLHFLTTASLAAMREHYPDGDFRVERYRPSFVIETVPELTGLVENSLRGARLKIGDCIIHCDHPTIRCSMPGAAQPGMAADPAIPMTVMRHADRHLGAYATPRVNGTISEGDTVELLPRPLRGLANKFGGVGQKLRKSLLDMTANLEKRQSGKKTGNTTKDGEAETRQAYPAGFKPFTLARCEEEATGIRSFYFRPEGDTPIQTYVPGQHIVLALDMGDDKAPLYRPYTLSKPNTEEGCLRISVKHEQAPADSGHTDGMVSSWLHNTLQLGDRVQIRGPLGAFGSIPTDAQPLVLVSGGIGITPFIAMLEAIADSNPDRTMQLFHSVGTLSELAFADTLMQLQLTLPNLQMAIHITREPVAEHALPLVSGRMELSSITAAATAPDTEVYVCGKPAFSAGISTGLEQAGVDGGRIHRESFGQPISRPGETTAAQRTVRFAGSDLQAHWNGERSMLELAEDAGLNVTSGCRYGACHACQATLVSGDYHYPDGVEEPTAKNQVLLCCMRPDSDITLDL